ncbi:MAG: hypothetical protein SVR08_15335 [Spirochaetota bacterium]|nr:hypothetical protein [Spirochaetota bacterium]
MAEEENIQDEVTEKAESVEQASTSQKAKNKKINKLSADELNSKLEVLDKDKQTYSRYYKHLLARKQELNMKSGE